MVVCLCHTASRRHRYLGALEWKCGLIAGIANPTLAGFQPTGGGRAELARAALLLLVVPASVVYGPLFRLAPEGKGFVWVSWFAWGLDSWGRFGWVQGFCNREDQLPLGGLPRGLWLVHFMAGV